MDTVSNQFEITYNFKNQKSQNFATIVRLASNYLVDQYTLNFTNSHGVSPELLGDEEENRKILNTVVDFDSIIKMLIYYLNDSNFMIDPEINAYLAISGYYKNSPHFSYIIKINSLDFVFDYHKKLKISLRTNEYFSRLTHEYELSYNDIVLEDHYSLEKFTKWLRYILKESLKLPRNSSLKNPL